MIRKILMVTLMGWLLAGPILAQQVPALVGDMRLWLSCSKRLNQTSENLNFHYKGGSRAWRS